MKKQQKYVWYASYGSNLLEERFICYIRGGKPKGSETVYDGCNDSSAPLDSEETYITGKLYFAKKSNRTWNGGGVGFISNSFIEEQTLSRMYLITQEQFIDVVRQESNLTGELKIDFEEATSSGSLVLKEILWYNKLIYLGYKNEFPIFTLTHKNDEYLKEINKPDPGYLKIIMEGLKESFNYNEFDILEYLKTKEGISGNYTKQELIELALLDF